MAVTKKSGDSEVEKKEEGGIVRSWDMSSQVLTTNLPKSQRDFS